MVRFGVIGFGILLEKPMTTDPDEARQIVDAARRSGAVAPLVPRGSRRYNGLNSPRRSMEQEMST